MTRRYAQDTSVSVEKSRAEIEALLTKYGATSFMSGVSQTEAVIAFEMQDRKIMFRLPVPNKADQKFTLTTSRKWRRSPEEAHREWEQACRSRWRALALAIKAKLEAVSIGITTFEDEFLAHIVLADGMTVGQHVRPKIAQAYEQGSVPALLPPPLPPVDDGRGDVSAFRFAYADPPYLGRGEYYKAHHPDALAWNDPETHRSLIARLQAEYPDGWALSLSERSLRTILPMCPPSARVAAWITERPRFAGKAGPCQEAFRAGDFQRRPALLRHGKQSGRFHHHQAGAPACRPASICHA